MDGQYELSALINAALNCERRHGAKIIHISTGRDVTAQIDTSQDESYTHLGSMEFVKNITLSDHQRFFLLGFHYNSCMVQLYYDMCDMGVDPNSIGLVLNLTLPYTKTEAPMNPWVLVNPWPQLKLPAIPHYLWSEQGFDRIDINPHTRSP
jgi:hypothetical protein